MSKTNQFAKVPNEVVFDTHLESRDVRVYAALRSYRNEKIKGFAYPAKATLARRLGCSEDTIERAIKCLVERSHLTYIKGAKGVTNRYQFGDSHKSKYTRSHAGISPTQERINTRITVEDIPASERHKPESNNHNHKPENSLRLFLRSDPCSVIGDLIKVSTPSGAWLPYGGGDEDGFRFGELQGTKARQAAIAYFRNKGGSQESSLSNYATD